MLTIVFFFSWIKYKIPQKTNVWKYILLMPSTRKQKAKEKNSRQSDVMSDIENMDVLLGTYSRNLSVEELYENVEIDLRSNGPRQDMVRNCEDFRTLLNTKSRSENGVAIATTRLVSTEIYQ